MFEIGQQVVCALKGDWISCIDGSWVKSPWPYMPVVGGVYTIRSFHAVTSRVDYLGLRFAELINPPSCDGKEPSFNSRVFRPVKKTSIEVFQRLLVKPPKVPVLG